MIQKRQELMEDFTKSRCHITACAQCGYRLIVGDSALHVHETGDVIHKDCWMDYFEENMDNFAVSMDF